MSETPKDGKARREEAIKEVEEMRQEIAQKRAELKEIRERFREAMKRAEPEKGTEKK